MWTVSVLGQSPRELRQGASGWEVSPDGTRLAFTPDSDSASEIWVMGSQGDNPHKVVAPGENDGLYAVHWSPDGQRLAYLKVQHLERYGESIETCDLKGANRTVVVSESAPVLENGGFFWLADGRIVYSRGESRDSDDHNRWQIGIDSHASTPIGKPKRVTQWAGSYLLGLSASADGKRLALRKWTRQAHVYPAELAAGGTRMNPPRLLTNDEAYDAPTA